MQISNAATGVLAAVCVAAGAGGAYLFTRPATTPAAAVQPAGAADALADSPSLPVEQSEGVVIEAAPQAPPVAASPEPRRAAPAPAAPRRERRPVVDDERTDAASSRNASAPIAEPIAPAPVQPPLISDNQVSRSIEPPGPSFEEFVVPAESVIGLQLESAVTSERARVEDAVAARVTRDVKVGDRVVIPAGSRAQGEVTLVERGGRLRERARLGVRFTSIVLADGTRLPIETETIYREGSSPGGESAAKIGGGAIGGAIIGGILGGAKGAAIGGSVGAGAGSAAVLAGGRNAATLSVNAPVTVRLQDPVTVTVGK